MTPVWDGKGRRNVATLTEDTLLEEGVLVADDPLPGGALPGRPRVSAGCNVVVGGFPGEARALRILGSRTGLLVDPGLGPFEWEVRAT